METTGAAALLAGLPEGWAGGVYGLLARPDYFWLHDSIGAFLEEQAHAPA